MLLALALAVLTPLATAGGEDFAAEAKHRMGLSFDLDQVQAELAAPAAAAPAPARKGNYAPMPLPALPLEPNSTLDHVVVLRDRAIVTRERTLKVEAGAQRVRFEGLPLGLDAGALHAELRSGAAKVVAVELVAGTGDVEETERIKAFRTEAEALSTELGAIRDHIESLLMQRAYLRGAVMPANGDTRPLPTLDIVKGTLGWVGEAERDLAAKLRVDEKKAEELGKKLEPLLTKLHNPLATGMTVRVDADVQKAGEVTLALRYTVYGAGWTPSYAARLDAESNSVTLETNAVVAQATGEAWKDATIQLSTADATVGGTAPILSPWILDESGMDPYALLPNGAARTGAGAMVIDVTGKRTIAGDGSQSRIPISSQSAPTRLSLATVPRTVPEVFRAAEVTWTGEAPLLPGPVASFVGGDYVGSATLDAVAPGEAMHLGFGVDDRLKVDRQLASRKVEHLMGGRTRYTVRYRTTVQNYSKQAQVLTVSDQLPVSQVDKISVTALDGTPADVNPEAAPGIQCWTLHLKPGETGTVEFGFVVVAPREMAAKLEMMMM